MAKFIQDILYFSVTTTGDDPEKDRILQLSAVLLDKDNLLDKGIFNEYIRVSLLDGTLRQHANFLGIEAATLQKSLKIYEALKKLVEQFGYTPLLACHQASEQWFLRQAFLKAGVPFNYDQHILDIWSLGYY
jgi:DNA polymerase III epsilon subunit-like protein